MNANDTGLHSTGGPNPVRQLKYEGHPPYGNAQFFLAQHMALSANEYPIDQQKTAESSRDTLKAAFDELSAKTGVKFTYWTMLEDDIEWHGEEIGSHGMIADLDPDEVKDVCAYLLTFYNAAPNDGLWIVEHPDADEQDDTVYDVEFLRVLQPPAPDAPKCGVFLLLR